MRQRFSFDEIRELNTVVTTMVQQHTARIDAELSAFIMEHATEVLRMRRQNEQIQFDVDVTITTNLKLNTEKPCEQTPQSSNEQSRS